MKISKLSVALGLFLSVTTAQISAQSPVLDHLQKREVWLAPYFKKNPQAAYRVVQNTSERNMSFANPGDVTLICPKPGSGTWWKLSAEKQWEKIERE
jgi:hypothetical protein